MASRFLAAGALIVVLVALVASPAGAKEGVVARVVTPISSEAAPGTRVTVVFTLTFTEAGKRHPFGGGAVFIRLWGPDDTRTRRVYAAPIERGRYRATARVPRGGVHRVVIGLMGEMCNAEGCRPSPMYFRIAGDPIR
jgi:hypothetical protein